MSPLQVIVILAAEQAEAYTWLLHESTTARDLPAAVIANFLSPGPYVFWSMLAGPVLVQGWGEAPARGIAFLAGFYGAMIGALVLLVVLFSAARGLGPRVNRALIGLSALALAGFGVYQLWQGLA